MAVKSLGYAFVTSGSGGGTTAPVTPATTYPNAAHDLSAHRVVILTGSGVDYPNLANVENGDAILGITTSSAVTGSPAAYQFEGTMMDPSWSWTVGPIFCGASGVLTQTPPLTGQWLRQVGSAVGPNTIEINLYPTYYLRNS